MKKQKNSKGGLIVLPPRANVDVVGMYDNWIRSIKERVRRARFKALMMANAEQVLLYWDIGREIIEKQDAEGWGSRIVERMSADLKASSRTWLDGRHGI